MLTFTASVGCAKLEAQAPRCERNYETVNLFCAIKDSRAIFQKQSQCWLNGESSQVSPRTVYGIESAIANPITSPLSSLHPSTPHLSPKHRIQLWWGNISDRTLQNWLQQYQLSSCRIQGYRSWGIESLCSVLNNWNHMYCMSPLSSTGLHCHSLNTLSLFYSVKITEVCGQLTLPS